MNLLPTKDGHPLLGTFIKLHEAVLLTLRQIFEWADLTAATKADPLLKVVTESVFLISLHSAADAMSVTRPLAVALQGEEQDLTQAVDLVAGVRQYMRKKQRAEANRDRGPPLRCLQRKQATLIVISH